MELITVNIDNPMNYFSVNDYKSKDDFIESMMLWYAENNWQLPTNENFGDYYDENKTEQN